MDTKALRQKILDLAIRGKLVPQDPNDEPASVLLERIRAEKQQMVKDGKLKPKDIKNDTIIFKGEDNLHYEKFPDGSVKCIENEIPFELPQGWEWCRLSVYTAIMNGDRGKNYPSKDKLSKDNSGIPFISASDINNGYVVKDNMLYMSNKQYELLSAGKLKLGDIVFCIRGSLGKCGRFMFDNGAIASSLVIVRGFVDEESYFEYLYQYLLSPIIFDEIKKYDNGSAQPNLAAKDFMKFFVPVPPLAEQHRIVSKINELLSFVDIIESDKTDLQTTIQLTKSKILDLAIRGKLVPQNPDDEPASVLLDRIRAEKEELIKQGKIKRDKKESVIFKGDDNSYYEKVGDTVTCIDEELPFDVPDSWGWVRLENCCSKEIKRGKSPKYTEVSNTLVFAQKCNTKNNGINIDLALCLDESVLSKYPKDEFMQDKDSVINSTGTGTLGRVGIYRQSDNRNNLPIVSDSHVTVIRAVHCIDADYIYIVLKAHQKNLEKFGEGSTNQKELKPATLKQLFIPLPPLKEQKRMVDLINSLHNELDQIEKILS